MHSVTESFLDFLFCLRNAMAAMAACIFLILDFFCALNVEIAFNCKRFLEALAPNAGEVWPQMLAIFILLHADCAA